MSEMIVFDDLLAQDLKTNKMMVVVIETDKDVEVLYSIKFYTIDEFRTIFKNRKVRSIKEFDNYISVVIERLVS